MSIKKISIYGFAILCFGVLLSGAISISLVLKYEDIKHKQQIVSDAHHAAFSFQYNTEKLLTSYELKVQKRQWLAAFERLKKQLKILKQTIPNEQKAIDKLWRSMARETQNVSMLLHDPLFGEKNIREKSLLRRLGEGLNRNESSAYYIKVRTLINAITHLQQYQVFLLEDMTSLNEVYSTNSHAELHKTKNLLILLPIVAFVLLSLFAAVLFLLSRRVENKLLLIQDNLSYTLSELELEKNKLKENRDVLDHMAHHDSLTGCPNRLLFMEQLKQSVKSAKAYKKNLAILFIDLDRFKEINDSLGHVIGDEVLKVVASRFGASIKNDDNFARLGGDEFTILIESFHSKDDLKNIAERIIALMNDAITIEHHELYMTCSIGISIFPDDGDSADTLLRNADAAMYKAKAEGKNTYHFYHRDLTRNAFEKVKLASNMTKALEKRQFELYYQPQVNPIVKEVSFEALIRWRHPDFGIVSPASFIPIAEETGLIVDIGDWVLESACQQIVAWHKEGLEIGRVAVNVASKQLHSKKFYSRVMRILEHSGCQAQWLALEVTEGMVMRNPTQVSRVLKRLQDKGIEIAIDDFGTGYSSLSYLKNLPIDILKIDQSFVRRIPENQADSEIVKAVVNLANGLQMTITAEGVETISQRDFLIQAGCHKLQGYFYSKPIPAWQVKPLLLNLNKEIDNYENLGVS